MSRSAIPSQGYAATRLKAVDLLADQRQREASRGRAGQASQVELPDYEYNVYEDITGQHAESYEQWAVNMQNPEYRALVEYTMQSGDNSRIKQYWATTQRVAKNLEQSGVRAREAEEMFNGDRTYQIPYNRDMLTKRARLVSSLDPDRAYEIVGGKEYLRISNPDSLSGTGLQDLLIVKADGSVVLENTGAAGDLYFFDKSMLIQPDDWMAAARKHSADIVKSSTTTEKVDPNGNIVTTVGGQNIDTDKVFFNSAIQLFDNANQAYMDDPGEDVELPSGKSYRLNALSASMYAQLYPDKADADYRTMIGKSIPADEANNMLATFVSTATEGAVTSKTFSRKIEGVRSGGRGGGSGSTSGQDVVPYRDTSDNPVKYEGSYRMNLQKPIKIKWTQSNPKEGIAGDVMSMAIRFDEDTSKYVVTAWYKTTPYKEEEVEGQYSGDISGSLAGDQSEEGQETRRVKDTSGQTDSMRTLTIQEANQAMESLGFSSLQEWENSWRTKGENIESAAVSNDATAGSYFEED